MKRLIPMVVFVILLASCAPAATPAPMSTFTSLPPTPTATFTPVPTDTPIPTVTLTPAPENQFGLTSDGTIAVNQVNFSDTFVDTNGDGTVDTVRPLSPAEIAAAQAYIDSHPEMTGKNEVGSEVQGNESLLHNTLWINVNRDNILAINKDPKNSDIVQIIFAQADPTGQTRIPVTVFLDLKAQQAYLKSAVTALGNADGLAAQLATLDHIQQFIDGSAPQLGLAIAMNGDPNSIILENSPVAFHLTTLLVNEGGVDLRQLVLFGNGDKPQNKAEQAASIKTLQFAAEYGSVVVVK
jgi:hypothetical protein